MSDLLNIGASGVKAFQTALSTVSENVANASTDGYTRRTISLKEVTGTAGNSIYYNNFVGFSGVRVDSVGRAYNDYQATSARVASSDAAAASARQTWLGSAETALGDDATGVGQSATALFDAGATLASNPGSTSSRTAFLSAIDQTASAFRTTAGQLSSVSDGITDAAQTAVKSVNGSLDQLDKINVALRSAQPGTETQQDLLDQRDQTLDQIAQNVGIDVSFGTDGSATVRVAGGGPTLESANGSGTANGRLSLISDSSGKLTLTAISAQDGTETPVATAGGAIGGLLDSARTVSDRRAQLDQMASDFATSLNNWNAAGTTAAGTAGGNLVSGTTAATLQVATSDPTAIAAAKGGASNGNLLALTDLRGSGGVEASWNDMVTDQGQLVANAKSQSSAATARSTAATSARDAGSGVDLDTEATELVRYQQAYNASAKVIQVARETMQSILDII